MGLEQLAICRGKLPFSIALQMRLGFPKSPPRMETLEVFTPVARVDFKDSNVAGIVNCSELGGLLLSLAMLLANEHLKIERGYLSSCPTLREITPRSHQCLLTNFVLGKPALPTK